MHLKEDHNYKDTRIHELRCISMPAGATKRLHWRMILPEPLGARIVVSFVLHHFAHRGSFVHKAFSRLGIRMKNNFTTVCPIVMDFLETAPMHLNGPRVAERNQATKPHQLFPNLTGQLNFLRENVRADSFENFKEFASNYVENPMTYLQ